MEINFTCPNCGIITQIAPEVVGQTGPCRSCDAIVTVVADLPRLSPFRAARTAAARSRGVACWLWLGLLGLGMVILVAVLTPVVLSARQEARRLTSQMRLKQIGNALLNYHDTFKMLPRAYYVAENGERRQSWRVAIFPFMELHTIWEPFSPDEPWDSPANLKAYAHAQNIYRAPWNSDSRSPETGYMVITGPGTLFEEGRDISFADCTDGISNTILAVEVINSGVHGAQPVDLDIRNMVFKINGGGMGIRSPWDNGANVLFADGSVVYLPKETLASTLKAMITRSGGEQVQIPRVR